MVEAPGVKGAAKVPVSAMDASGEPAAKRARSDSAPPGVAHEREVLGRSITDALLQASSHVLKEYMPDVTTERQARAPRTAQACVPPGGASLPSRRAWHRFEPRRRRGRLPCF